jgi:hypothetical protein
MQKKYVRMSTRFACEYILLAPTELLQQPSNQAGRDASDTRRTGTVRYTGGTASDFIRACTASRDFCVGCVLNDTPVRSWRSRTGVRRHTGEK